MPEIPFVPRRDNGPLGVKLKYSSVENIVNSN